MKSLWRFLPVGVFVLLAVFLYLGLGRDAEHIDSPLLEKPLPVFALPDLSDPDRLRTQEDFKGAATLLNVWATWCISCRVEHPFLVRIAREQGVRIVGLNYKDDGTAATTWLQERGDPYAFTIVDADGRLGLDLGVYGAPETYLLDAHGVIRYKHVGVIDERVWVDILQPQWKRWQSPGGQP
ncbi:MAG: DsbE family thiol:disulfide interchange protein [Gammaproteobacteria bacterium]|nr:MAG: DsbE family thiol:disulfide interchange protein [Gammaproteobacteria bacterium]